MLAEAFESGGDLGGHRATYYNINNVKRVLVLNRGENELKAAWRMKYLIDKFKLDSTAYSSLSDILARCSKQKQEECSSSDSLLARPWMVVSTIIYTLLSYV